MNIENAPIHIEEIILYKHQHEKDYLTIGVLLLD